MENHVGFSGTRGGMTPMQKIALMRVLTALQLDGMNWFHHGDCVGADEEAHKIAQELGYRIHVHPPMDHKLRAYCVGDKVEPAFPYRRRNEDIVRESIVMVFCPKSAKSLEYRSGTGMTYRIAKELDKHNIVCYPDGTVKSNDRE